MTVARHTGRRQSGKRFGVVEWFHPGDHALVEQAIHQMNVVGASYLRTHVSWAEYHAPGGEAWYDWLLKTLGNAVELLPCAHFTPPSLSRNGTTTGAPRVLKDYADFIDHLLTRHGTNFTHIELWNEPNNLLDWDWRADPDCALFCEMVGNAAYWAQKRGWKVVLPGACPFDPHWLDLMGQRGLLKYFDAAGFHGFPGTWDSENASWLGWDSHLLEMRSILKRHESEAEIWITETGYSTWRNDEVEQARRFLSACEAPAQRIYWYGLRDIQSNRAVQEGQWFDQRHYHLGLATASGRTKLLGRLLGEAGSEKVADVLNLDKGAQVHIKSVGQKPIAVIGGAGFIGCNLSDRLLADGKEVILVDSLARAGAEENIAWLQDKYGSRVHIAFADIRNIHALSDPLRDARAIFHLAGQTAVTTSLVDPRDDFEVNALGTFNVLEAVRRAGQATPVIFASTNKVYGALSDLAMREEANRYVPEDKDILRAGIGEARALDFCTPYGCSKGTADQYMLDYAKSFGIPTAVLRMSCIYGPHQFGTEDQGWVAHFLIRALQDKPITIYGNGKQVRDILHVHDAVDAYCRVLDGIDRLRGRAFNLGGGPTNAISLRMLLDQIESLQGRPTDVSFETWRQGDQPYFVADTRALYRAVGWQSRTGWKDGVGELHTWLARYRIGPRTEDALAVVA